MIKKILKILKTDGLCALIKKNNTRISAYFYKQYIFFVYWLHFDKMGKEQKKLFDYWKFFCYLRRKYSKFIKNSKIDTSKIKINSTKIIWWCWLQGEENAPALCKACLKSVKKNFPDYEVKIITNENMWDYITVPKYIRDKYEKNIISRTHFSDILRTCLLVEHGGVWIDSSVFCTDGKEIKPLLKEPLFFFQNSKRGCDSMVLSSWFLVSCKDNPYLELVQKLLFEYWKKNSILIHYFLYHFFVTMIAEQFPEMLKNMPYYSNLPCHIMQAELFNKYDKKRWNQLCKISSVHKLTWKTELNNVNINETNYEHISQLNLS